MIAPQGRRVGPFEIRAKLGRGGMADVYLATNSEDGHEVALKVIEHSHEGDSDTRDAIEAERRGAALQAQLAAVDARVTRVYGIGDADGYFYVAMEYIDGEDLAEKMRRERLPFTSAVQYAAEVAGALENAHNLDVQCDGREMRGIVHGDIKPKNIRVDARGQLRVLDFGIAKALSQSRKLTRNEFGSVPYASPERLDTGEVDARSDLWSLAVMLYEMLAGVQPYSAASTEQLERMVRSRVPPPPAPDPCPDALRRILVKALHPDPLARYQAAREFAADLQAFLQGEPVRAVAEELDATRRTTPREPDGATRRTTPAVPAAAAITGPDEATRRTSAPLPAPAPPAEWAEVAPRRFQFPRQFTPRVRTLLVVAAVFALYLLYTGVSSWRLYARGQEFRHQLETEQVKTLPAIWTKWTELSEGHSTSWVLYGARQMAKKKIAEGAGQVIAAYRQDTKPLYEGDWERARLWLSRALELDPDDAVRADLRLCEGHLARINGTVHRNPADLNNAVAKFEEARKLAPKSPDPLLGLARVYVYGLKDIDKAYDCLNQAEQRNYRLGNRDKAQLADGYRDRADRLWQDSANVRGLPQERDQIERARQDYQRALDLYQGVAPYGNANDRIVRIQTTLGALNARLAQMEQSQPSAVEGASKVGMAIPRAAVAGAKTVQALIERIVAVKQAVSQPQPKPSPQN